MLGEVDDPGLCLREVSRVTKDHGSITVVETRRDGDFLQTGELAGIAYRAGLVVTKKWGWRWEYTARLEAPTVGSF